MAVSGHDGLRERVSAETTCQGTEKKKEWVEMSHVGRGQRVIGGTRRTFERSFSPEAVPHLHVVVPAQVAPEHIHGGEVQDDLRGIEMMSRRTHFAAGLEAVRGCGKLNQEITLDFPSGPVVSQPYIVTCWRS